MRFKTSLRSRITFAFALMGIIVSLALAGALYMLSLDLEKRLVTETLSLELDDYILRYRRDQNAPPPASTAIRTYVFSIGDKSAPDIVNTLRDGFHRVSFEDKIYYAQIRLDGGQQFSILYDAKQILHRENQTKIYFAIGVSVMALFSAFLGYWLSGRVTSPVGELAARVAGLAPEDHRHPLASDFPKDEVGVLAREFDAYLQRIADFVEREQAFTSDVSHELRTPLAVIKGATEVLLEDQGIDYDQHLRVERIDRATQEMSELVSALLQLAREENDSGLEAGCMVSDVLRDVTETHKQLFRHKSVKITLDIRAHINLRVECTLLRIVLTNLIRNAMSYTEHGQVGVSLDEGGVSVMDTGVGISDQQIQRIFERYYTASVDGKGIGLSLVKRICKRYGWTILIHSHEGQGTTFRLSFY